MSVPILTHEFDSSLTCNYCGRAAERISAENGNADASGILCLVRREACEAGGRFGNLIADAFDIVADSRIEKAVAAEREACAAYLEDFGKNLARTGRSESAYGMCGLLMSQAKAIRSGVHLGDRNRKGQL